MLMPTWHTSLVRRSIGAARFRLFHIERTVFVPNRPASKNVDICSKWNGTDQVTIQASSTRFPRGNFVLALASTCSRDLLVASGVVPNVFDFW
jgi:hypothetical protein